MANEALAPVWELCTKYEITKTQLALSYVLSHSEVSTVIPGIRTPHHVEQNTNGLVRLDEEDVTMIEKLGRSHFAPVMETIKRQG